MKALQAYERTVLNDMADEIRQVTERSRMLTMLLTAVLLALSAVVAYLIARGITRPLAEAVNVARTVADGDLTTRIDSNGSDEIGELMQSLQRINESLAGVVTEMQSGTQSIAIASGEIAAGNQDLSARTGQRSAAAAKDIKQLITDSVTNVDSGTRLVDEAGKTMSEIVVSIARVTDIMGEIANASEEQSSGIGQVNDAITQMDQVTQQNAALVEEAAAAAESMQEQAGRLRQVVAVFKTSQAVAVPPPVAPRKQPAAAGDDWEEFCSA